MWSLAAAWHSQKEPWVNTMHKGMQQAIVANSALSTAVHLCPTPLLHHEAAVQHPGLELSCVSQGQVFWRWLLWPIPCRIPQVFPLTPRVPAGRCSGSTSPPASAWLMHLCCSSISSHSSSFGPLLSLLLLLLNSPACSKPWHRQC